LVVSYDSNGAALNSFFVPNVAIANGQTIDLTAGTYAGVATRTYTFVNPPMYSIQIEDRLIDTQGEIWRGSTFESGSAGSLPVPAFAGAGDVVVNSFQGSGRDTQFLVDWGA